MATSERQILSVDFGTITDRRVTYQSKNLFGLGGSSQEDVPLRHITSVGLGTSRHPIWGVVIGLFAIAAFSAGSGGAIVVGFILLAFAILLLWGSPQVRLSTAGNDRRFVSGPPWKRGEASKFVSGLRQELFKDADAVGVARWG